MVQKYFSKKVIVDGIKFDSKFEANWYVKLRDMEERGFISNLEIQPRFEIIPPLKVVLPVKLKTKTKWVTKVLERAAYYTADFQYERDEQVIVMECKSKATMAARDYPLRRKLIRHILQDKNDLLGIEKYVFKEVIM